MLEISNYKKAQIANQEFGKVTPTLTTTFRLKLFTNTVDLDGVGTELTTAGYAALDVTNNLTNFPLSTDGVKTNAVAFPFAALSADSGEIVSAGIFDATTGELLYRKVFPTPFTILSGNYFNLAIGELRLTIA